MWKGDRGDIPPREKLAAGLRSGWAIKAGKAECVLLLPLGIGRRSRDSICSSSKGGSIAANVEGTAIVCGYLGVFRWSQNSLIQNCFLSR